MTIQGRRVAGNTRWGDMQPGDYYFDTSQGIWFAMTPLNEKRNSHLGNLGGHEVTEHPDGTITVSPSILIYPSGDDPGWHGWLRLGVWTEA